MLKAEVLDVEMFKIWLEENKDIAAETINVYVTAVNAFLKTDPDLEDLNDYNRFLIKTTIKKRSYGNYYALKLFIEYKIPSKKDREKLLDHLVKPKIRMDFRNPRKYLSGARHHETHY